MSGYKSAPRVEVNSRVRIIGALHGRLREVPAMPRKLADFPLPLAVMLLALLLPGNAVAGPPQGLSGKMVLDEVADGLQRYRIAKDTGARMRWLKMLATTHDARIAIALGNALDDAEPAMRAMAARALLRYWMSYSVPGNDEQKVKGAMKWWQKNEAEMRRRAKELPQ